MMGPETTWQEFLVAQISLLTLPQPIHEYQFHGPQEWRVQFAWPDFKVGIEIVDAKPVDQWIRTQEECNEDCRKWNYATLNGWKVLRFTQDMVKKGLVADILAGVLVIPET